VGARNVRGVHNLGDNVSEVVKKCKSTQGRQAAKKNWFVRLTFLRL
jgi:hypothetical protein